jgi:hypothetical protein
MEYLITGLGDISEVCPASAGGGCTCNNGSQYCSGVLCLGQYCVNQCTSNCTTLCISKTYPCGFVCPGNVVPISNVSRVSE